MKSFRWLVPYNFYGHSSIANTKYGESLHGYCEWPWYSVFLETETFYLFSLYSADIWGKMLIYMNNTELLSYLNYIIMPRRNSELVLAVGQQAATPNVRAIESTSFRHIPSTFNTDYLKSVVLQVLYGNLLLSTKRITFEKLVVCQTGALQSH